MSGVDEDRYAEAAIEFAQTVNARHRAALDRAELRDTGSLPDYDEADE